MQIKVISVTVNYDFWEECTSKTINSSSMRHLYWKISWEIKISLRNASFLMVGRKFAVNLGTVNSIGEIHVTVNGGMIKLPY